MNKDFKYTDNLGYSGCYPRSVKISLDQTLSYPHYSDSRWDTEQTIYGNKSKGIEYNYSDRLMQFSYENHKKGEEKASNQQQNTARYYLEYLKGYYGKDIDLQWIGAGVNRSNGYPYWIFGYKVLENDNT